jgi:hypothetical protein
MNWKKISISRGETKTSNDGKGCSTLIFCSSDKSRDKVCISNKRRSFETTIQRHNGGAA